MPKPSTLQIRQFKDFERRQQIYERKYQRYFLTYLSQAYTAAAKQYKETGVFTFQQNDRLDKILTKLYKEVIIKEAVIAYNEVLEPLEGNRLSLKAKEGIKTKDVIDDLINILSPNNRGLINIWQSLLNNFLQVRLSNRITRIHRTTEERISKIIEEGIFEGWGQEETARVIRKEARGEINLNRSRVIARTETVISANQGKYISAQSSNLVMQKKWIPAKDQRTRRSHIDMLNREWIPLEDDFWLANEQGMLEAALYPGDERLSAGNTINCRCSIVFEAKRDATGSLIRKR